MSEIVTETKRRELSAAESQKELNEWLKLQNRKISKQYVYSLRGILARFQQTHLECQLPNNRSKESRSEAANRKHPVNHVFIITFCLFPGEITLLFLDTAGALRLSFLHVQSMILLLSHTVVHIYAHTLTNTTSAAKKKK
ncbi:hypothetical protein XELAEV_18003359mg [Xenopus laevis]|uniref:Uncharacterized protein n=1 Tax=Xenopus laevis TaxID=8355 RepID=A0A974BPB5_XENLA|nr:hypothetical protein XELAEV_18003359mg [Xenopus laevis]